MRFKAIFYAITLAIIFLASVALHLDSFMFRRDYEEITWVQYDLMAICMLVEVGFLAWFSIMTLKRLIKPRLPVMTFEPDEYKLMLIAPILSILAASMGWLFGYRVKGSAYVLLLVNFAFFFLPFVLWPKVLRKVFWQVMQTNRIRHGSFFSLVLLSLMGPCIISVNAAMIAGRASLERSLDLNRLFDDCVRILEDHLKSNNFRSVPFQEFESTTISRLNPSGVFVSDAYLQIELHGGFDHYGYRLTKSKKSTMYTLSWYMEYIDGRGTRILVRRAWNNPESPRDGETATSTEVDEEIDGQ